MSDLNKKIPELELKMEPQLLDYKTVQHYLPEKWEMLRNGKLLSSDQELQKVLKMIVYNLGGTKKFRCDSKRINHRVP
ncbi:hypothetical protein SAMN05877753_1051 [Bacillus oleivorans]|uniref:Uncharacterized protein n=1 Tax=Bacillus oleivorans TaxID=1448271 RepID=A0A285CUB4_9BACI|nr:hypothetical protein [Bacillus oleivorans]SNX71151.1 hypothetical protein SAMN05877753_1051 [Bacillus oleivorans]